MSGLRDHALARLDLPGSPRVLAVVRAAVCLHVVIVLTSPALDLIFALPAHRMPWAETVLPAALERLVASRLFLFVDAGLLGATFAALGLFTRPALVVTAVCFFLTQNFWFRMSLFHDDWLYFNVYLWVLALSPCADVWSLDAWLRARRKLPAPSPGARHRLAIELMTTWFAGIYVAAGLAKIFPLVKLPLWISGARAQDFAQEFLLDSPVYWLLGRPAFDYGATRWPFALGAVFTLSAELGAVTLLLTTRFRWLVLPAILSLHAGIFLVGIPGFVQAAAVAMTVFIPPRWLGEPSADASLRKGDGALSQSTQARSTC